MVQNAMRAMPPGAMRTLRRRANTGSSTVPVVCDSVWPDVTASGFLLVRLRPMKRILSVSYSMPPDGWPSTTARCAAQISGSDGARRRRVATSASLSARNSVCTNNLENTGCAMSAPWEARTSSAQDVTSISRTSGPELTSDRWRTSALSSPETITSIIVVNVPSRRENAARSSLKITS